MLKKKKVRNLIEEKEAVLTELSETAKLSMQTVQAMVEVLDSVSVQMQQAEDEIDEYVKQLTQTGNNIKLERERNTKVASNFKKLLCME